MIAVQQGDEGRLVGDFALKFEYASLLDDVRAAVREGAVHEVEVVRREDDRTFLLRIAPYRTSEQTIEGAVLTFVDISRIKGVEKQLREALEHLRFALDAGRMGMWEWDLVDGDVVWDDRSFALLGLDPARTRASLERFLEAVHLEDRDELRRTIDAVVASGEPYNTEFRVVLPDGSVRWLRGLGQAQRDASGRAVRLIGVNLDTTERRRRGDGPAPPAQEPKSRSGNRDRHSGSPQA